VRSPARGRPLSTAHGHRRRRTGVENTMRYLLILTSLFAACGDDEPVPTPPVTTTIEIAGRYNSNFGGMETITSTSFNGTPIRKFSNATNFVVIQNPADSMFGPNLFSKIVWTEKSAGAFHYCFVDFGKETLVAAETSTQTADASMPDQTGCGMFSWTKLTEL